MFTRITRRSAVSILGAGLGMGAVVGASGLSACGGGGGSADGATSPGGSNGGGSDTGALAGSFWYERLDKLYVSAGGTQEPTTVNQYLGQGEVASHFAVERTGPRYLQRSHFSGATASDWTAVLNVYEHASHQAYCYVNLAGYVAAAAVSPSGKYIAAFRSPQLSDSTFQEGSTHTIVDLMIIDDRITAFDQGYSGTWSPDGRHIFFKAGSESRINCNPALGCPETCSSHYVSSSARAILLTDAQTLELGKVPCYSDIMWRA